LALVVAPVAVAAVVAAAWPRLRGLSGGEG